MTWHKQGSNKFPSIELSRSRAHAGNSIVLDFTFLPFLLLYSIFYSILFSVNKSAPHRALPFSVVVAFSMLHTFPAKTWETDLSTIIKGSSPSFWSYESHAANLSFDAQPYIYIYPACSIQDHKHKAQNRSCRLPLVQTVMRHIPLNAIDCLLIQPAMRA